jgi:hypothetical protein
MLRRVRRPAKPANALVLLGRWKRALAMPRLLLLLQKSQ